MDPVIAFEPLGDSYAHLSLRTTAVDEHRLRLPCHTDLLEQNVHFDRKLSLEPASLITDIAFHWLSSCCRRGTMTNNIDGISTFIESAFQMGGWNGGIDDKTCRKKTHLNCSRVIGELKKTA